MDRPYASITFLTYEDLDAGVRFYGDALGLPLVEDQGWAKVYRVSGDAYVGLVASRGRTPDKPVGSSVLFSIVVNDVDAWYDHLRDEPQIETLGSPARVPGIPVYGFFLRDPAGYRIEIQAFTNPATANRFRST